MTKVSFFERVFSHFLVGSVASLGFPFALVGMIRELKYGPSLDGTIFPIFVCSFIALVILYFPAIWEGEQTGRKLPAMMDVFIALVLVPLIVGVVLL